MNVVFCLYLIPHFELHSSISILKTLKMAIANPLDPRYKIVEASEADMDEIMRVCQLAFGSDEIWQLAFKACDTEDIHSWLMEHLVPRWNMPDIITYKCQEVSSGKIVAWTALQFPWTQNPKKGDAVMTKELKEEALDHSLPPQPEGCFEPGLVEFFNCLGGANDLGYDPETEYHRKGTMVHPDFQKQGLGSALTQRTNDTADKLGSSKTWAPARSTSIKMFRNMGFLDIGEVDGHLERFGVPRKGSITYIVRRDA
ncbi:hypothetical protein BJ875DRAFT_451903 [Amylocarpus encephaloides]|uniref:N-acetyltransferase domain-containing protein n=1 Tax=Amylocarpus encephaloides TaxID=45428 RepID=A0A9P7YRI6_9HELO|nr:hypothetical protein BJ875DRAFT_451903 [Amylocarpus encephaloides]